MHYPRNKIVPRPGIMRLGTPDSPVWVAASAITTIGYITAEKMREDDSFKSLIKALDLKSNEGVVTFNVIGSPRSICVPSTDRSDQGVFANIWAEERLIK